MKYLKSYKLFESNVNSIIDSYISDIKWDIENSLGNCAFFAKDFYEWCQSNEINCKLIYCEQSAPAEVREDHIIPMIDNQLIDFVYTDKGVSKKVRENSLEALNGQMTPEITPIEEFEDKYGMWGYSTTKEISYDEAFGESGICKTIELTDLEGRNLFALETIKIPIKVGDTVLGGRFKNKKMVVKKIGKNKKGDITINDKPLLKFRLVKESFQEDIDDYLSHLKDDGFVIEKEEDYVRIFKPKYGDFYAATNLEKFNFSEIAGDIARFVDYIGDEFNGPVFSEHSYTISGVTYLVEGEPKKVNKGGLTFTNPFDRKTINIEDLLNGDLNFDLLAMTIHVK